MQGTSDWIRRSILSWSFVISQDVLMHWVPHKKHLFFSISIYCFITKKRQKFGTLFGPLQFFLNSRSSKLAVFSKHRPSGDAFYKSRCPSVREVWTPILLDPIGSLYIQEFSSNDKYVRLPGKLSEIHSKVPMFFNSGDKVLKCVKIRGQICHIIYQEIGYCPLDWRTQGIGIDFRQFSRHPDIHVFSWKTVGTLL